MFGVVLGSFLGVAPLPTPALASAPWATPSPVKPELVQVGSELIALNDVKLREATIAKGSRVKVREITRRGGQPVAVALELKDGHVLRGVAYRVIEHSFRLASSRPQVRFGLARP